MLADLTAHNRQREFTPRDWGDVERFRTESPQDWEGYFLDQLRKYGEDEIARSYSEDRKTYRRRMKKGQRFFLP
jgi:hypothetical protein